MRIGFANLLLRKSMAPSAVLLFLLPFLAQQINAGRDEVRLRGVIQNNALSMIQAEESLKQSSHSFISNTIEVEPILSKSKRKCFNQINAIFDSCFTCKLHHFI